MRNLIKPKQFIALAFLLVFGFRGNAQKSDYRWLCGYESYAGYDSVNWHHWFGITELDFNDSPVSISYDSLGINFSRTSTSYCDSNGELMFYTNGIYIANALDEKIENSDSMNWGGYFTHFAPSAYIDGYRTTQGIYALPWPGHIAQYILPHTYLDTINNSGLIVNKVLYTFLDMSANAGHGKVLQKNMVIAQGVFGWEMAAVRHGNGRDWWVVVQKQNSNCYQMSLLDTSGIHLHQTSCGGTSVSYGDVGAFAVSPDGSKIVHFNPSAGVNIFDFDRCNGTLSNNVFIPIPGLVDSGWFLNGAAISPNNRYVYIGATTHVYQYDLQAADIEASRLTVATYDGHQAPFGSYFHTMQMGPDGKIYESCGNSETVYHVIDRPDEPGDSCLFRQHGLELPSYCLGVPSFPNYRLGALAGSGCDTLNTDVSHEPRAMRENQIQVFPNPASGVVTVDYGFTDWSKKGWVSLQIVNELGQLVYEQPLPQYSGFQKVNVSGLVSGVYHVLIKRDNAVIGVSKFSKD